jgi:acyl-CoA synthetase (AMP-forming)/AMP-acid ligase II
MQGLDDTQVFLPELWATHARFFPDKEAVVCGDRRATWGEFNAGLNRVANALGDMGIGKGDKVAVLMANSADMLCAMFGVVKAGACVVPLSALLASDQLAVLIDDSDAVALIVSAPHDGLIAPVRDQLGKVRADGFIGLGFEAEGWREFGAWTAAASDAEPGVDLAMEDDFNIIYSSGTTGLPKGIVQTHRARQHWSYSNAIEMRFSTASRALTTTGLYSNGTWLMVLPVLFTGGTLVVMEQFEPEALLATIARERISHTFMVPTQYIVTLAHPKFDDYDLNSLQVMLSAGSPLRLDTKKEILERFGPGLYELYGCSEGTATMLKPERMLDKFASVGTPVLGFDMRVVGDDDAELPWGETGEIVGYGGGLMKEYHKRPEETQAAIWRDPRGRSFVRTGDIGRFDEQGFLYIVDRKKDMIISGGFNVFPTDIEAVLGEHEDVLDVTVIGVKHEKWGETPLALVIPAEGADSTAEALMDWANARLAKHQRLSGLEFRDEFPRNELGNVLKRELRAENDSAS